MGAVTTNALRMYLSASEETRARGREPAVEYPAAVEGRSLKEDLMAAVERATGAKLGTGRELLERGRPQPLTREERAARERRRGDEGGNQDPDDGTGF